MKVSGGTLDVFDNDKARLCDHSFRPLNIFVALRSVQIENPGHTNEVSLFWKSHTEFL